MPVATFGRVWEAELARGALEAEDIPAFVDGASVVEPYPSLAAVGWSPIRLLVPEDRSALARGILEELVAR